MDRFKRILVTGGCGFIGTNLTRWLLKNTKVDLVNIDKMSYASDHTNRDLVDTYHDRYKIIPVDLKNLVDTEKAVSESNPDLIIHLAAESHVDRSIESPIQFIESNIIGTFNLLEATRKYLKNYSTQEVKKFKFHHVSTDEVYGSLGQTGKFNESSSYDPRSPYSASKASSDHLVMAWHNSYKIPITISNCSNNYGPFQFPEKLIPLSIKRAKDNQNIPLYGDGLNIRDWLFVDDHIRALILIISEGLIGHKYCIGGDQEFSNKEVLQKVCLLMDKYIPSKYPHSRLIKNVKDRPGHDRRYAIDFSYLNQSLGWKPLKNFDEGLEETLLWYLDNEKWCYDILKKSGYGGERIGEI